MYTNIIHNDDICNYFLKNQQFIFNSLGNCRECRFKWTIDQILEHEAILYPEQERFTRKQLEDYFTPYKKANDFE